SLMKDALFVALSLMLGGCASGLSTAEMRQRSFSPYEEKRIGEIRLAEFLALRTAFVVSEDYVAGTAAATDKRGYFITAAHCLRGDPIHLLVAKWRDGSPEMTFERSGACRVVWR